MQFLCKLTEDCLEPPKSWLLFLEGPMTIAVPLVILSRQGHMPSVNHPIPVTTG